MKYQTKYHKFICEGLRWACFLFIIATLAVWLVELWAGIVPQYVVMKMTLTTLAFLLASVMTSIIFYEPVDKSKAVKADN